MDKTDTNNLYINVLFFFIYKPVFNAIAIFNLHVILLYKHYL